MTSKEYAERYISYQNELIELNEHLNRVKNDLETLQSEYFKSIDNGDLIAITKPSGRFEGFVLGYFLNNNGIDGMTIFIGPNMNSNIKESYNVVNVKPEEIEIIESYGDYIKRTRKKYQ